MALLLSSLSVAVLASTRAHEDRSAVTDLDVRAHRAMGRIVTELSEAGRTTLAPVPDPPFGSSSLSYQRNIGYTGAGIPTPQSLR